MSVKSVDIGRVLAGNSLPASSTVKKSKDAQEFSRIFEQAKEKEGLKFSKHAKERIVARDIRLSSNDVSRLAQAVNSLNEKGGKTSLVFFGDTTFLTNVENRTIITALDNKGESQKIFTKIDSAVLVDEE